MPAALLCALACGGLATQSAIAGGSHRSHGKRLILSPRSHKRYPARPVFVRVRVGKHAKLFRAQLNGKPIGRYFKSGHRGVRHVRVSANHGLRHGRNRLHVKVKRHSGRKRSASVRFRIRHNRPLAAAGFSESVTAGAPVLLDSTRSRSHLKAPSVLGASAKPRHRSDLDHHWKVLSEPPGASQGAPGLDGEHTSTPVLWTTVPGTYKLKLTVTATDGKTASDKVPVKAYNPPLMSVDTMTEVSGDQPGIKVGEMPTFHADDSRPNPWFQVVVLNIKDGTLFSNKTYSCTLLSTGACDTTELQNDLAGLDDTKLVIAANHMADPKWVAPTTVAPFQAIGVTAGGLLPSGYRNSSFSAIGVPGAPESKIDPELSTAHADPSGGSKGQITGTLIKNNNGDYNYLPPKVSFDTQAYPSDQSKNIIQVNGKLFQAAVSPPAGVTNQNFQGGFQVVVLDAMNLERDAQSQWFPTGMQDFDSGEPGRLNAMSDMLEKANAAGNKIVIIASRGDPATQGGQSSQQDNVNSAVKRLVDAIEALGGTRTAAYQALAPGVAKSGASYTLVGHSGAGVAHGVEAQGHSTTPASALNQVPLQGSFKRGDGYQFEVAETAPSVMQSPGDPPLHMAGQKLNATLVQPDTPWPDQSGAPTPWCAQSGSSTNGEQLAIAYIGDQKFNHDDVRTDYWRSGYSDSDWETKQAAIANVSYPTSPNPGFTSDDLAWAKCELTKEIDWVKATYGFGRSLGSPFADGGLQSWADMSKIAADVNNAVQESGKDYAYLIGKSVFDGAREAAEAILALVPGAGEVVAAGIASANAILETTFELIEVGSKNLPADEPFQVQAGDYGAELVNRFNLAQGMLQKQIPAAVVSDYGRLKTVGACHLDETDYCPDNPEAWKFDSDTDQPNAAKALRYGAEISDYQALVPARWKLYQLGDSCRGNFRVTCWENGFQGDGFWAIAGGFGAPICPFLTEGDSAKLVQPVYRDIPQYRNDGSSSSDLWRTYALGNVSGAGLFGNSWLMEQSSDFLGHLFTPIDPNGNPAKGGLGVQPEQFFLGNMTPVLMKGMPAGQSYPYHGWQPYPYQDSHPEWGGRNTSCVQWGPSK